VPLNFQVLQEPGDGVCAEIGERHVCRSDAGGVVDVGEQHPPGVAVGVDGVAAGRFLSTQVGREVGLQARGESGHEL
jgi:hypothetical protein